jgi:hypothetical protein
VTDHVRSFDDFYSAATRAYITTDGTVDYARFAQELLAGVFLASFNDTTRDRLRAALAQLPREDFRYDKLQHIALTDEGVSTLTDASHRQIAMEAAMRASARYRGPISSCSPKLYGGQAGGKPKFVPLRSTGGSTQQQQLVGAQIPCNNCGAGSQFSPHPWHMTIDCPAMCTVCRSKPHLAGCPRLGDAPQQREGFKPDMQRLPASSPAQQHQQQPTKFGRFERHPQRRALARAHSAITEEVAAVAAQLVTASDEEQPRLQGYKSKMETDLAAVRAGETAFLTAVALGEVDENFEPDGVLSANAPAQHAEEKVSCHVPHVPIECASNGARRAASDKPDVSKVAAAVAEPIDSVHPAKVHSDSGGVTAKTANRFVPKTSSSVLQRVARNAVAGRT